MKETWKVGVAGLGVVGGALVSALAERPRFAPAGAAAIVSGVSARRKDPGRSIGAVWFDDPVALAQSPETDIFIELIGGSEGAARASVEAALSLGKPVVTANKALIAQHGAHLAALAESTGAPLLFEAAVMGGAPVVKMLREAVVGDEVLTVAGILNGTCNFILSEMEKPAAALPRFSLKPRRSGSRKPIRRPTWEGSTRVTRSRSWRPSRSAARRPSRRLGSPGSTRSN